MLRGFSLIELSIVLVILGLLTGGIITGQSLIRAAEIRKISTQFQRFQTATLSFRDKYFALPGDIMNATSFWGIAGGTTGNDLTCFQASSTDKATCNGDGNGQVRNGYISNLADEQAAYEMFRAWQHLANAGLIEGTYTGRTRPGSSLWHIGGVNAPAGPQGSTCYSFFGWANTFLWGSSLPVFSYGGGSTATPQWCNSGVMSAEEVWNIDTKLDDGRPGMGIVLVPYGTINGCATTAVAATAEYALSNPAKDCGLSYNPRL